MTPLLKVWVGTHFKKGFIMIKFEIKKKNKKVRDLLIHVFPFEISFFP